MSYFPFFTDITGKQCLIVGGGEVALRKVEKLLPFDCKIRVCSKKFCQGFYSGELKDRIEIVYHQFMDADIDDCDFVIAATDNEYLNGHVYKLCAEKNIPVNVVDDMSKCTFIFPSLVKGKNYTAAFTTEGKSPLCAAYMAKKFRELDGERLDNLIDIMYNQRKNAKKYIYSSDIRAEFLKEVFNALVCEGANSKESIMLANKIMKKYIGSAGASGKVPGDEQKKQ